MDIFPSAVNTIVNHQGVAALSLKIQNLEFIDLAEKAIKALERISSESASSILSNANLDIILNMMDFFELNIQISILKMVSNV
jgi:E3 ubiquitin-protein ligase TRIP12